MKADPDNRINRPRQIYVGERERSFVPLEER
jgi:citrate synthase